MKINYIVISFDNSSDVILTSFIIKERPGISRLLLLVSETNETISFSFADEVFQMLSNLRSGPILGVLISLTATAKMGPLFSFRLARRNGIFKAKRK